MKINKARRILAVIALAFMAIATVTLVMVLAKRSLVDGVVGWLALVSALLGVGLFLVIKFVLKEKSEPPEYLPEEKKPSAESQSNGDRSEQTDPPDVGEDR